MARSNHAACHSFFTVRRPGNVATDLLAVEPRDFPQPQQPRDPRVEAGQVQHVTLLAGQGIRIAPGTVHWGRAGPEGVRAVASWVKPDGQPLRTPVPE